MSPSLLLTYIFNNHFILIFFSKIYNFFQIKYLFQKKKYVPDSEGFSQDQNNYWAQGE